MLSFVLSNSTWKNDELSVTFRQPFDLIAETTTSGSDGGAGGGENSPRGPDWRSRQDSNLRPSV
jgi:site-specific DNA recombinase